MKHLMIAIFFCTQLVHLASASEEADMTERPVVEIVIFKVSDPEEGMMAARAIVEDAKAFNNAIISAEIYQSASDPNTIAQRITWKSLEEAKAAFTASERFPSMKRVMEMMTEHLLLDHFYEQ